MKADTASKIRVGLLIFTSLLILALTILLMGKERRLFESRVPFEIYFSRTNGLRVGAPISLTGVMVGSVESIGFPQDVRERYVVVRIKVAGDVASRIRKDMVARVRTQGVLGDKFIELSGGSTQSEPLGPGGLIRSVDPIDYEALLGESGDLVQNFTEATSSLRNILGSIEAGKGILGQLVAGDGKGESREIAENLRVASASLRNILRSIEKGKGPLGELIGSDQEAGWLETADNFRAASASLKRILGSVEQGEGLLGQLVRDGETPRAIVDDLRVGLRQFRMAAESLRVTVDKVARGEGTLGALIQDPDAGREILTSLSRSAANLESLSRELRQGEGILKRLMTDRPYAERLLRHLEQTARDLAEITGRIERGDGTLGALLNDRGLYDDAREVLTTAKGSWLFSISHFFRNLLPSEKERAAGAAPGEPQDRAQPTGKE
jgi:phospholipid/cholesterol/gamma-HCH transport system substrate-binding protein